MKFQHLNLTNRCVIEKGLAFQSSFREIAAMIGCSTSTVMREVRNNREFILTANTICSNYTSCLQRKLCGSAACFVPCKTCHSRCCHDLCKQYVPRRCELLVKHRMYVPAAQSRTTAANNTHIIPPTKRTKKAARSCLNPGKYTRFRRTNGSAEQIAHAAGT